MHVSDMWMKVLILCFYCFRQSVHGSCECESVLCQLAGFLVYLNVYSDMMYAFV